MLGLTSQPLLACPFCSAVSQTLSEEMSGMDAVVVARLAATQAPQKISPTGRGGVVKATFEIVEVLKGKSGFDSTKPIETVFFGGADLGDTFVVMGVDPPNISWSTPLKISDRALAYLRKLGELPAKGPDRLAYFQQYLEDDDDVLARDAYDEFARAPYDEVKALKPKIDREQVIQWIKDPDIPANRRRLYLVMLSVSGSAADVTFLEEMLRSEDRKVKAGLDAMIGCYLILTGSKGMPLVEELFLKNKAAEYADTYAAIMALRFHGTETDVIPRERLLEGLRHILARPQLADLVIPDLARWQDWSQIDRLVQLFKDADDKSSWVRVPVINYLRACPNPVAKKHIEELQKIDPEAVKRANTFFPFGGGASTPSEDATSRRSLANPLALSCVIPIVVGISQLCFRFVT
jgi:hypothetical protein